MKLTLQRLHLTDQSTTGDLLVDGAFECHTLELPVKDGLPGSAIPPGTYRVTVADSPHFRRPMPLLVNVPGRSEIEIHWGDFPRDTRGCILVGVLELDNSLGRSRDAFNALFPKIQGAPVCWIEIQGGMPTLPLVQDVELGM